VDSYVSRYAVPGAAVTKRLVVLGSEEVASSGLQESAVGDAPVPGRAAIADIPNILVRERRRESATPPPAVRSHATHATHFSLSVIEAGGLLWLENLEGMPLATDQVRLIAAMAHALSFTLTHHGGSGEVVGAASGRPETTRFDWPMHSNRQLDVSDEAAKASLTAYLLRKIENAQCRGIVLLGDGCQPWVDSDDLPVPVLGTHATSRMLADAALKIEAWHDLASLRSV
jgi:hypothetical protein